MFLEMDDSKRNEGSKDQTLSEIKEKQLQVIEK